MTPTQPPLQVRALIFVCVILAVAALRASYPVAMPLAAAAITIIAIWPAKAWLDRVLPSSVSYLVLVLGLLLISAAFAAAIYLSISEVVDAFARGQGRVEPILQAASAWASRWHLQQIGGRAFSGLLNLGQAALAGISTVLIYVGFTLLLTLLGLFDAPQIRHGMQRTLSPDAQTRLLSNVESIGAKVRVYFGMTAVTSLVTAIASALWAWVMGLELAAVWGILNGLLNFIPIVGNIVGTVLPTIYAIVQFGATGTVIVVFVGFACLQVVISNVIYPALQGRGLSLSPALILIAIAFWSWLWGVAGTLLAVPLTVALIVLSDQFGATRWIAACVVRERS